jgi:flagellin-like hook-associated protein FlgL
LETALLTRNQLLQQSALQALSITSFKNQDVLSLLERVADRY